MTRRLNFACVLACACACACSLTAAPVPRTAARPEQDPLGAAMFGCEFETSNNVIPVPGGAPPQPPDGLTIISVYYESAAQRAGFKNNDVITSFNGAEVTILYDLKRELTLLRPGATVPVTVKRDGKTITLRTRLGDSIGIKPEPEAIVIVEP